jgi:transcriptional regulator with XRE-family HTH domain
VENIKIGERIRRIRAAKGLTQGNVAHELGISFGAYAKIERGETDASMSRITQIAEVLEVSLGELFGNKINLAGWAEAGNPYGFADNARVDALEKKLDVLSKKLEELIAKIPEKKTVKSPSIKKKAKK